MQRFLRYFSGKGQRRFRPPVFVAAAAILVATSCSAPEDLGGPKLEPSVDIVLEAAAEAMGDVTSVRFELVRGGAAVYIDPLRSLSLDEIVGRYSAPTSAEALLTVTIDDSLRTKIGAVALDGEVWMSNPVTGTFEPLPAGYDIDPTTFFDPQNGWRPLLSDLTDVVFVGEEQRNGTRYHLRATAPADRVAVVTAGLVSGQDVEIDVWLHPVSGLVMSAEFETLIGSSLTAWTLELSDYGEPMVIEVPDELA